MVRNKRIFAVTLLLLVGASVAPRDMLPVTEPVAAEQGKPDGHSKVLSIGFDSSSRACQGYYTGKLFDESAIRNLIRKTKQGGFDEVYWRLSICGRVNYRSKVMTRIDGDRLTDPSFSTSPSSTPPTRGSRTSS